MHPPVVTSGVAWGKTPKNAKKREILTFTDTLHGPFVSRAPNCIQGAVGQYNLHVLTPWKVLQYQS